MEWLIRNKLAATNQPCIYVKEKKCVHADTDVLYISDFEHFHCQVRWGKKKKKRKLIKKLKVWGEDCSSNVGCSGRCVAAGCVCVCARRWEWERDYFQTSKPFDQSLGMGKAGWRRVKKIIKKAHPQSIKPNKKERDLKVYPHPSSWPDCNTHTWLHLWATNTLID